MEQRLRWNGSLEAQKEHLEALCRARKLSKKLPEARGKSHKKRRPRRRARKQSDYGYLDVEFQKLVKSF